MGAEVAPYDSFPSCGEDVEVPRRNTPLVLMYHGFGDPVRRSSRDHLFVRARDFRRQLEGLLNEGKEPLTLDQYTGRASVVHGNLNQTFLITIDDAFKGVVDIAAPILMELHVPATIFAPSRLLGKTSHWMHDLTDEPIMSSSDVQELRLSGFDFGSHSATHADLTTLPRSELVRELSESRADLSDICDAEVSSFAYPFGGVNAQVANEVEKAGYSSAFSMFKDDGNFSIPRVDVLRHDSARSLRLKMTPVYLDMRRHQSLARCLHGAGSLVRRLAP